MAQRMAHPNCVFFNLMAYLHYVHCTSHGTAQGTGVSTAMLCSDNHAHSVYHPHLHVHHLEVLAKYAKLLDGFICDAQVS